ncbi:coiled-coil domain-containing protein 27 [Callorhinchus milii]|nr:coiled-coil domain-containing protein 27 [Callorhinchus milii]|eukprot:gi/632977679/ref/XP_007905481.1/ PREDICTED: coiled-coil domain-containing protein 27 [Callorhinchus milii]
MTAAAQGLQDQSVSITGKGVRVPTEKSQLPEQSSPEQSPPGTMYRSQNSELKRVRQSSSSFMQQPSIIESVSMNELLLTTYSGRSSIASGKQPPSEAGINRIPWYIAALHEKEQSILNLEDRINSLSVFEVESARKDQVISELRADVAQLTHQATESSINNIIEKQTEIILTLQDKLNRKELFEAESKRKDVVIIDLRKQIHQLKMKNCHWDVQQIREIATDTSLLPQDEEIILHIKDYEAEEQAPIKRVKILKARKTRDAQKGEQRYRYEEESEDSRDELENVEKSSKEEKEQEQQEEEHVEQEEEHVEQEEEQVEQEEESDQQEVEQEEGKVRAVMFHATGQFGQDVLQHDEDLIEQIEQLKEQIDIQLNHNEKQSHELQSAIENYNISIGTIISLRKEQSNVDNQLRSSNAEVERLQKELQERTVQIQAMSNKFSNLKEEKKHIQIMADLQKENFRLEELVSELQQGLAKKTELSTEMKNEINDLQLRITDEDLKFKQFQMEHNDLLGKLALLRHTEQQTQVLIEHLQIRFDKIRTKIMQAVHTSLGTTRIQNLITDKDILDGMQKIITDRIDFHQLLMDNGIPVSPLFITEPGQSRVSLQSRD